ncbi:MAG: amidase [Neomegalonema sp.]|nr:amidase [Neomegalonema sp.]
MEQTDGFIARLAIQGAQTGPLSGRTFAAKDLFDIAGHVTGAGNPDWARTHGPAADNAFAVDLLLRAGASLAGKTHTDELAYSLMGVNAHYGVPINPAAPDRVPGGSSSGSVSVTAAGLVDIGLGSDTGGSVRLPASFCGVYGMRPTHGAIATDGLTQLAPSFDTVGWFASDINVFTAVGEVFGAPERKLDELPAIVCPYEPWEAAEPETCAALRDAGAPLGLDLTPLASMRLTEGGLGEWREAFRVHQAWEIWRIHGAWISKTQPSFGPGVKERFAMAQQVSDDDAAEAHDFREAVRKRMRDALQGERLLALPTSPGPAPLLSDDAEALEDFRRRAFELLCIAGLAGLPQISIPLASVDGAPVGLSLIGAPGEDGALFRAAKLLAARSAALTGAD